MNVSVAQFRGRDLTTCVMDALNGLDPARLIIEITESTLMQKDRTTIDMLHWIRESGIRFAVDDFGTGYSSLSYLRSFPFNSIKIDRSFITSVVEDERSQKLLSAIARLGRALKMSVVAEGVETLQQFEFIKSQVCTDALGYFFAGGLPGHQVTRFF